MSVLACRASLGAALFLIVGCAARAPDAASEASPTPEIVKRPSVVVHLARVVRRPLVGTVSASGEVVAGAGAQANLAFPTPGQIASVAVAVGNHVTRGDVLARLDDRVAQREVEQATADVNAAEASLAKASAGARPQELAQNRALAGGAEAKAHTAQAELQRQQSLATVGIASRRDLEQARAAYADALADLRDKQQAGSLLLAGPRHQDVAFARAQLEQSRAALATAQTRESLLTLVAPFDGVVTARLKNPGEVVDTTATVMTLVDPKKALVSVRLSEDQAAAVAVNDPASMTINGAAATVAGHVSMINAALDPATRTLEALITPQGGVALRSGATASARITVRTIDDAYVVPARAIVKDPETGQTVVFSPTGGDAYRRIPVRIVLQSGRFAAVDSPQIVRIRDVATDGAYELLPFAVSGDSG